jgi:Putative  PD-(D/E)XK family member, (DUF4420)
MFEVKATGPSKPNITISNIDQLDFDEADPPLYLFRISVGKRPAPVGKTLVKYIDEVRKELKAVDSELLDEFNSRLAGKPAADLEVEDAENDDAENKDWESKGYRDEQKHEYTRRYQSLFRSRSACVSPSSQRLPPVNTEDPSQTSCVGEKIRNSDKCLRRVD